MIPDALLDRAPILIHIAQFEADGIPEKPQLFTSEEELFQSLSDQLANTNEIGLFSPFFPRLPDESPIDHVNALLDAQEKGYESLELAKQAARNGRWSFNDDTLRLWEAEIKPKPTPPAPQSC